LGEIINSLRGDKSIAHPTTGAAAIRHREKQARTDALEALIVLVGRIPGPDSFVAQVAKMHGLQRAIDCAEVHHQNADVIRDRQAIAQRRQAEADRLASLPPGTILGPPGHYKDEEEIKAPVQRSVLSSNPAAYNADRARSQP